ncbi:MAG: hypothetical protein ACAF41_11840 [Leptolyngbya sp. BL-A-14]
MQDVAKTAGTMPRKIQVTLPDRIGDDLQKWADYDGRPLANLCNFLLERAVIEAKEKGAEWAKQPPSKEK